MRKTLIAGILLILLMVFSLWCSSRVADLVRDMTSQMEKAMELCSEGNIPDARSALTSAKALWDDAHVFTSTLLREDAKRSVEEPLRESEACLSAGNAEDAVAAMESVCIQLEILRKTDTLSWESLF